jgi:hypothetical protein
MVYVNAVKIVIKIKIGYTVILLNIENECIHVNMVKSLLMKLNLQLKKFIEEVAKSHTEIEFHMNTSLIHVYVKICRNVLMHSDF